MADDTEDKVYKFEELSKEAKERAIQDWIEQGYTWDSHNSDNLSHTFKEILIDKGFGDNVEVYWSLGYCQGDGVCFSGYLDLNKFLDQDGFRTYREMSEYLSITIRNNSYQHCHWNSMNIEVRLDAPRPEEMLSSNLSGKYQRWRNEVDRLRRTYENQKMVAQELRMAPIRAWEVEASYMEPHPLSWYPDFEKPPPADVPDPEEPDYPTIPADVKKAIDAAMNKIERYESKLQQLEEDVAKWVKDVSKELEKIGYEEIEYQGSDEVIAETLIGNDYEFTEDGERV
jgi:hypothetical protein